MFTLQHDLSTLIKVLENRDLQDLEFGFTESVSDCFMMFKSSNGFYYRFLSQLKR